MKLKTPETYFITYFLAAIGAIFCFLPSFRNLSDERYEENLNSLPLHFTLHDKNYQFCLVASIAVTLPIIADISIDTLLKASYNKLNEIKVALWMLMVSSLSASLIVFFYVIPNSSYRVMISTIQSSAIFVFASFLNVFHAYGPSVWKGPYIWAAVTTFSIGQINYCIYPFSNEHSKTVIIIVEVTSYVISCLILFILALLWIRKIVIIIRTTYIIPNEDICCTWNVIIGIIYLAVLWAINIVFADINPYFCKPEYHIIYLYLITSWTVIITGLNARFLRTNIILAHAKREAETKRMLVGYFSHEIRTPLNSILMGLQLGKRELKGPGNTDDLLNVFEELHSQCDLAVDILNDLLLYERLEEGIIDLNFKPVSMKPFLHKKIKAFLPQCKDKGVELNIVFPNVRQPNRGLLQSVERAYCRGDEDKLGQVIRTLLSNAIECTPKGKLVTVEVDMLNFRDSQLSRKDVRREGSSKRDDLTSQVSTQNQQQQSVRKLLQRSTTQSISNTLRTGSSINATIQSFTQRSVKLLRQTSVRADSTKPVLRVRITDEGPGIAKEDQETIFDNALSFTAGVLQVRQGKGLGLWISHNIMTLHQGEIFVSSDGIGKGSTFTIEVPVYFVSQSGQIKLQRGLSSEILSYVIAPSRRGSASSRKASGSRGSLVSRNSGIMETDLIEFVSDNLFKSFRGLTQFGGSSRALIHPLKGQTSPVPGSWGKRNIDKKQLNTIRSLREGQRDDDEDGMDKDDIEANYALKEGGDINSFDGNPEGEKEEKRTDVTLFQSMELRTHPSDGTQSQSTSNNNVTQFTREDTPPLRIHDLESVPSPVRTVNVLVVDDAPMNRRMLCRLLLGHCDSTSEAEDGEIAVEMYKMSVAKDEPFVLILMDYQMPNMDGPTAARRIRELGYKGPIIGVTGNTLPQQVQTFLKGGADRVLSKPLHFKVLTSTLKEIGLGDLLRVNSNSEHKDD